jgi:hypothetical protein
MLNLLVTGAISFTASAIADVIECVHHNKKYHSAEYAANKEETKKKFQSKMPFKKNVDKAEAEYPTE